MSEEFDFEHFEDQFKAPMDGDFDEIAKGLVPIFLAFRRQGLNALDASVLTISFITQLSQNQPRPPEDITPNH